MVDNIPDPEMWTWFIETSDAWAEHVQTCWECQEHDHEDDVWRIQTECPKGKILITAIKDTEIALGITPTNR